MKVLVTGGGGFLGKAIVHRLLARGDEVRSLSRSEYPELSARGVKTIQADISDPESILRAIEGCEIVFHVAAKAGIWGAYEDYYQTNVVGTENVIAACREHQVQRLIYTSSPSVTFEGKDQQGVDESEPYATYFLAAYPETKAIAEKIMLAANDSSLATVALRPHLIWGPGDNHLVPRVIEQGRKGSLRLVAGGKSLVDSVYIDNAAEAHILAADRLGIGRAPAGKAYYISNGEPIPMVELLNSILNAAGMPPIQRSVPASIAYAAGMLLESVHKILGLSREPRMTCFLARQLATAHWFDLSAAEKDLGYRPKVTIDEGLKRLSEALQ